MITEELEIRKLDMGKILQELQKFKDDVSSQPKVKWPNKVIGIVSGYFNPIHGGHIDYIKAAAQKCDTLIAIVNNDDQVKLKGSFPFMDENHRLEIVGNIKSVDDAIIAVDSTPNVCETIRFIRKKYPEDDLTFFNSGDRVIGNTDNNEIQLCAELGIRYFIIPLPKRFSSSDLIKEALIQLNKRQ